MHDRPNSPLFVQDPLVHRSYSCAVMFNRPKQIKKLFNCMANKLEALLNHPEGQPAAVRTATCGWLMLGCLTTLLLCGCLCAGNAHLSDVAVLVEEAALLIAGHAAWCQVHIWCTHGQARHDDATCSVACCRLILRCLCLPSWGTCRCSVSSSARFWQKSRQKHSL